MVIAAYQKQPYVLEATAALPVNVLLGLVIQNTAAGIWSVFRRLMIRSTQLPDCLCNHNITSLNTILLIWLIK